MSKLQKAFLIGLAAAGLAGCSHAGSVSRAAIDYNRAMADARNEQLLINILRAGAREPLQFSALAEINASVNRTVGIDTVASNLITGGRDMISPTVKLGASTVPTMKIQPLSNKEFTEGILRPIAPETLHLFINQGWDTEFLLPLVIAGYRCPGDAKITSNPGSAADDLRDELATSAAQFNLHKVTSGGDEVTMTVPAARALQMLGDGVAAGGYKVASVKQARRGTMSVVLKGPEKSGWSADLGSLCPNSPTKSLAFDASAGSEGYIQLRSVEGIIYFLGEAVRPCLLDRARRECRIRYVKGRDDKRALTAQERIDNTHDLFRVASAVRGDPEAAISTRFHGRVFSVMRLDSRDLDRSLKTLSFLSQLVALQTAAIPLTPTIIALPQ